MSINLMKNIIHRYNSIDTNIFCSFNTRNLYLDSLILPTENTSYFSTQNNGNNAITQINDIQFFNYDFILTNYLNEQIINLSNTSEIPLVLVTQTAASDINLELLNSIDNLYYLTIADSEHNVADQYKDRVLQIPLCSSMEAPVIKDIDKIKDIAIINYNTTKINPSIIALLKNNRLSCDTLDIYPASINDLITTLSRYRYCIDFSNASPLECFASITAKAFYISTGKNTILHNDLFNSVSISNENELVKVLNKTINTISCSLFGLDNNVLSNLISDDRNDKLQLFFDKLTATRYY